MNRTFRDSIDFSNAVIAFGVWLLALVVYSLTRAGTLSFWDCGEFIAAARILGIPHPPGSPLYILVGRLFSLLPLSSDVGVRMNLLSAFCSSFTALFGYLMSVRILRLWFDPDRSAYGRLLIYGGAASGALFLAFGFTNWTNSVEAEVYGMAMMFIAAVMWLGMVYLEMRGTRQAERIMLLIVFLTFLGIGIHMTTFLVFPVVVIFFIIKKETGIDTWYAVAIFFAVELYLVFALSSRPDEIPYYLPVGVVFLVYLFYVFSFDKIPRLYLYACAGFLLAIAPVYALAVDAVREGTIPAGAASGGGLFGTIGQVAFVGLILFGLYCLFRYFSRSVSRKTRSHYLAVASFILAAAVMAGLLLFPKGYKPFLILSAVLLIILSALWWRHFHWPILVAVASVSLVVIGIEEFLYGMLIGALVILALGLGIRLPGWKPALMIIVMAVAGFSVHLFIPIRSACQPSLNENNPSKDLKTTVNYLERKQYGAQSMIERMFKRRAEWGSQFGNYRRMGFWGFFHKQYGLAGPKFVFLFLVGLFGVWEIVRRRPVAGLPFLVFLLISTVGLVLYMNFADGLRTDARTGLDHIEVRDRDYFFTPGFILFGLAIGMGVAVGLQYIRDSVRNFSPVPRKVVLGACLVLLLLPSFALGHNYYYCDRSRNFIAYDYAWNLLQSADENAIFLTNGDNDTFPLWCLQEAYGVRTDVKVVNLSLANAKWYIKQLQSSMGLDLGWSEKHIDGMRPFRVPDSATLSRRHQIIDKNVYAYMALSAGELDSLWLTGNVPYSTTFKLNAMVIDKLIYSHFSKIPINFSVTTSQESRKYLGKSIGSRLSLNGMMWRLNETGGGIRADMEASIDFFTNPEKFKARGVNDPSIYLNEATRRLTRNWANGFLLVADSLRIVGDLSRAEKLATLALEQIPHAEDAVHFLARLFSEQGRVEDMKALIAGAQAGDLLRLKTVLSQAYRKAGDADMAEKLLKEILSAHPTYRQAFDDLLRQYFTTTRVREMELLLEQWLKSNPNDKRSRMMLKELRRGISLSDTVDGGRR